MVQRRHPSILIGDRVRCYALPGVSESDYITGIAVGLCELGGTLRVIVEAESRVTRGQADPCRRRFFEPMGSVVSLGPPARPLPVLHRVA